MEKVILEEKICHKYVQASMKMNNFPVNYV